MDALVKLDHGMTFAGTANSGFTVVMGTSPEVGGEDDGVRPIELVLIGLGGCTAMDVISILRKKRQDVTGLEVRLHAPRAPEHPKVFTAIRIEYVVRGRGIDPEAVARAIELSSTKYCPAEAMLGQVVPIEHVHQIVEEPV
jgi:putative redox protein